jgi:putative iron-only hydrogenase system regulator
MEKKIAAILILIKPNANTQALNALLSEYGQYILSRQGINLSHRNISIITIVVEADNDIIGAISGKLGRLQNVKVKTAIINPQNS